MDDSLIVLIVLPVRAERCARVLVKHPVGGCLRVPQSL
jgi:hypothetical protein